VLRKQKTFTHGMRATQRGEVMNRNIKQETSRRSDVAGVIKAIQSQVDRQADKCVPRRDPERTYPQSASSELRAVCLFCAGPDTSCCGINA
jgi:hypothetical protein